MKTWLPDDRLKNWMLILWGIVLFTLPVTSFRWLPEVFGKTDFRPLSFYPLAFLAPLVLVYLWRSRKSFRWPVQTAPLAAFLLVALIATLLGSLYGPPSLRGQDYWNWALRTWISLAIGMGFFWVAVVMSRSEGVFRASLKWMYASLILTILWGLVQAAAIHTPLLDIKTLNPIQLSFSVRGLVNNRISGFAFEPAWLADQIVIFYFPWLFGALLTGFRLTKYSWLEPVLLLGSLGTLLLTYSRSGIFGLLIVAVIVMLTVGRKLLVRLWSWVWTPLRTPGGRGKVGRVLLILGLILVLAASIWWLSSYDYFARIWQFADKGSLVDYIRSISAAPRVAYSLAGLEVNGLHPFFGVGLGGSSFYLFDHLPNWAYENVIEITRQVSPDSNVMPVVRNMFVRLLAETGIVGFWLYLAFMLSILGAVRRMFLSSSKIMVYASTAGLSIWLAVMIRFFTTSTLTSPTIWISLGVLVGYAHHILEVPRYFKQAKQTE